MPGMTFTLSEYPFDWIELARRASGAAGYARRASSSSSAPITA
jgi:hypothetical protein